MRVAANRTAVDRFNFGVQLRVRNRWDVYLPTVSPFTQTHAMESMRTRNRNQSCDRGIHTFQTDWTCGEFIRISMRYGLGDGIFHVDHNGQNVYNMTYFGLYDLIRYKVYIKTL